MLRLSIAVCIVSAAAWAQERSIPNVEATVQQPERLSVLATSREALPESPRLATVSLGALIPMPESFPAASVIITSASPEGDVARAGTNAWWAEMGAGSPFVATKQMLHYKTADKWFITVNAVLVGSAILDAEATAYTLRHGGAEANPLFGSHPSRLRIYATELPITALLVRLGYKIKMREDLKGHSLAEQSNLPQWLFPTLVSAPLHVVGAIIGLSTPPNSVPGVGAAKAQTEK